MISVLVEGVVVPNIGLRGWYNTRCAEVMASLTQRPLSDHDIEQFEDDPLEFIRLDLSVPSTSASTIGGTSSEAVTRRQAAADVLKALVAGGLEEETTEVVGSLIQKGLETYSSNPRENWRSKDVAVYLLGAIATRGSTVAVRYYLFLQRSLVHPYLPSSARSYVHELTDQRRRFFFEQRIPRPPGPRGDRAPDPAG